jgi:hypothetical protein
MLYCAGCHLTRTVGVRYQLTLDAMHWNSIHPKDEPIDLPLDLGPDVEWRINAPDEDEKKVS